MATITTATNPTIYSWPGNSAPAESDVLLTAAATCKQGQLGYDDGSNKITVVTTTVDDAQWILGETRDTAANSTTMRVRRLQPGTQLLMRVKSNATDETESNTCARGTSYGVIASSNITYLDSNATGDGTEHFKVIKFGSELDGLQMTSTLSPGYVLVEYTD